MITQFKIYEAINVGKLEIGDFVICNEKLYGSFDGDILQNFINNTIGKFVEKFDKHTISPPEECNGIRVLDCAFAIEYDNIPENLLRNFDLDYNENPVLPRRWMQRKEIKYWSKNKKDLEYLIIANKYNL